MLTAFAMCYFLCEISLIHPVNYIQGFLFLILLAAVIDYGIWNLGDS
jgi:hypothetical protein